MQHNTYITQVPLSTAVVIRSLVISHALPLTMNEHMVSLESVGSWKPVHVTVEVLVESGQTPQSDSTINWAVEQIAVQLNVTCPSVISARLTLIGAG